jgi:hypothetical protein
MDYVKQAKENLKVAQEALRKAEAKKALEEREKKLKKNGSEFPPGFTFKYVIRSDAQFDNYYVLYFNHGDCEREWRWDDKDEYKIKIEAREAAWGWHEFAIGICRASGLLEE